MNGGALTDLVCAGVKPLGVGRSDQMELAGNAFEWTLDSSASYPSACVDCIDRCGPVRRAPRRFVPKGGELDHRIEARSSTLAARRDRGQEAE